MDDLSRAIGFEFGREYSQQGKLEFDICRAHQHLREVAEVMSWMLREDAFVLDLPRASNTRETN